MNVFAVYFFSVKLWSMFFLLLSMAFTPRVIKEEKSVYTRQRFHVFRLNYRNTRKGYVFDVVLVSLLTVTIFSSVSTVEFEQANVCCVMRRVSSRLDATISYMALSMVAPLMCMGNTETSNRNFIYFLLLQTTKTWTKNWKTK